MDKYAKKSHLLSSSQGGWFIDSLHQRGCHSGGNKKKKNVIVKSDDEEGNNYFWRSYKTVPYSRLGLLTH
jgi:hypothetical protein